MSHGCSLTEVVDNIQHLFTVGFTVMIKFPIKFFCIFRFNWNRSWWPSSPRRSTATGRTRPPASSSTTRSFELFGLIRHNDLIQSILWLLDLVHVLQKKWVIRLAFYNLHSKHVILLDVITRLALPTSTFQCSDQAKIH